MTRSAPAPAPEQEKLMPVERKAAGGVAFVLLGAAFALLVFPPARRVALANCSNAPTGCVVSVDSDMTTLATALAAAGTVVALIAILGLRFNKFKGPGWEAEAIIAAKVEAKIAAKVEAQYDAETGGLAEVGRQDRTPSPEPVPASGSPITSPTSPVAPTATPEADEGQVPVTVEIVRGLDKQSGRVPVAITRLTSPMRDVAPSFLREYQLARRLSQNSYFLTHILGPATQPRQKYSVAVKLVPHREASEQVIRSASFYLGRSWGHRVFEGKQGDDKLYGVVTEAYGPFLALCEVEFTDGSRVLLDHYCDFEMGKLLPA